MGTSYKIDVEAAIKLRERIRITKNATACRRMEAVALLGEGKTPEEVSWVKKYNAVYVRRLGCLYNREGMDALEDGRKGGNHRLMSKEETAVFLEQFKEDAKNGEIITVGEIAKALDKQTGKERKSLSTAYYLLHSLKWRKLMPRSKHPKKASREEIESSKKLTLESEK